MWKDEIIVDVLTKINNGLIPSKTEYYLHLDLWGEIIESLQGRGYLTDVTNRYFGEHPHYDEIFHSVDLTNVKLTDFGLRFINGEKIK